MRALIPEDFERGTLRYERFSAQHGPELAQLMTDPIVGETLWSPSGCPDEAELARMVDSKVEHWERYGFGMWLLTDLDSGEFVGRGGLQWTKVEGEATIEVGWALIPAWWGRGLATELAQASVDAAFGELALDRLVAFTLPHNISSRRVMEKSGFGYERDIVHAEMPHVLYARGA